MSDVLQKKNGFFRDIFKSLHYTNLLRFLKQSLINSIRTFIPSLQEFVKFIRKKLTEQYSHINDPLLAKLKRTSDGLYSLLPSNPLLTYTFILVLDQPKLACLKRCLESITNESYPLEIVIGFMNPPKREELEVIASILHEKKKVKFVQDENDQNDHRINFINRLVKQSTGHFLIFIDEEGWARPDFLFRYDQTLRIVSHPEKAVFYCDVVGITDKDALAPLGCFRQPHQINFPFFFDQINEYGMLISKDLWEKVDGLRANTQGAEWEDLFLRASRSGADIQHVPFPLCACRKGKQNHKTISSFINVLEDYCRAEQLDWKISPGYLPSTIRGQPALPQNQLIQVVILYKDQKELTLKCIDSLLKQSFSSFKITAVDNQSADHSIAEAIKSKGGEVIRIDEPFNYSRLNNLAVAMSETAKEADLLLFLNNDVELDPDALEEMVRWIDQPNIGMVGCRLHYPNNRLQHGGVVMHGIRDGKMCWSHIEKFRTFESMDESKRLTFVDAVTAACAMVKRKDFIEVGGFDEIWYPIAFSDTNLACKLASRGLRSFFTPYAVGVHHESVSRQGSIEDYENSLWLHNTLLTSKEVYR